MSEGYIKYNPTWIKESITINEKILAEINRVRSSLISKGCLGVLPNGIGFGNISIRLRKSNQFLITGSATGGIPELQARHLALVESVDISRNALVCRGLTAASSESMSHAIIYQANAEVQAVIHIHDATLWTKYLHQIPTTNINIEYGTPEMAFSIEQIILEQKISSGILVMGGHEDGLISYAPNMMEASSLFFEL